MLAWALISPGLPGSQTLWLCTPAPIPPHTSYFLVLVIIQGLFPLPISLVLEVSRFPGLASLGPLGPQAAD